MHDQPKHVIHFSILSLLVLYYFLSLIFIVMMLLHVTLFESTLHIALLLIMYQIQIQYYQHFNVHNICIKQLYLYCKPPWWIKLLTQIVYGQLWHKINGVITWSYHRIQQNVTKCGPPKSTGTEPPTGTASTEVTKYLEPLSRAGLKKTIFVCYNHIENNWLQMRWNNRS